MPLKRPDPESLAAAPPGTWYTVSRVVAPDSLPEWGHRLAEIGFIPGETVRVLTRGMPGGDPVAVRVGHSTFALRRAEADCVKVEPLLGPPESTGPEARR